MPLSTGWTADVRERRKDRGYVRESLNFSRFARRSGTLLLAVATAGFVLSACGGGKNVGAKSTSTTAASTGSTTTGPASSSSTVAPTTTTSIQYNVPQVHTGTGPATLAQFSVPGKAKEWDIDWEFDCRSAPSHTGTFSVTVLGHGSAANTTDAGVAQQQGQGTAGIVKNYDTGSFNLKVATPCQWTVRVEVLA